MEMFSDSRLVVGQVQGELEARDLRMQEYLNWLDTYSLDLSLLICHKSLEVEIHMLILLPHWQPTRHKVYLG